MSQSKNIALILPLFYEYARNLRRGVIDWIDQNPGWRIIELDPHTARIPDDLKKHFSGVITWSFPEHMITQDLAGLDLYRIDCTGTLGHLLDDPKVAGVTYDRQSMTKLTIEHFSKLDVKSIGHVGVSSRVSESQTESIRLFKKLTSVRNMNYETFELNELHPSKDLHLIWQGDEIPGLTDFIKKQPKPLGLFASDDYVGAMLCQTAMKLGYKIPQEVAVLGQGDRLLGRSGTMPLSTIELPGELVGHHAAERLSQWILTGRQPTPRWLSIPCEEIIMRTSTGGQSMDLSLERAKRHLERHSIHGLTLQELASVAGYTEKTLRAKFLKHYGINIKSHICKIRLDEALHRLTNSEEEVSSIASHCGFGSASSFFNFILKHTGCGPSEYRNQYKITKK